MSGDGQNNELDITLEAELKNPRVIGCSIIIKDNKPIYNHVYTNNEIINNIQVSPSSPKSPSIISSTGLFSKQLDKYSNSTLNTSKIELNCEVNSETALETKNNPSYSEKLVKNEIKVEDLKKVKKDFSIWRCLCWPDVAISPIHSSGYGQMRLSICLNKIISPIFSDKVDYMDKDLVGLDEFELLPYIRVYYNDELLFQSCVINKNMYIILDIDVHHPLSNITVEIYDFDDSDPSLVGNFEDCITQITIPVGAHSNRKPLETQLVVGVDEETRLLFIRKSHQNKVKTDNLVAQKLLRFPIINLYENNMVKTNKSIEKGVNKYSENNIIECEEAGIEDEFKILGTGFEDNEKHEKKFSNTLSNEIYYEISNKVVKNAIELSRSAESRYKATGKLQNPHCTLVVQIYSEIKWTRLSLIPREIFALYLPEPKLTKPRSSNRNLRLENRIRTLVNTIIILRELFLSDCFSPIKDKIWKLHNWESYTLSFFAFSIIWYTLFHPEYLYSLFFSLLLYILVKNFNKKDKLVKLESYILARLRPSQLNNSDTNLDLDLDFDSFKSSTNYSQNLIQENCTFENEVHTADRGNDFAILETLLSSSVFSPNSLYYIQKISVITEGLTRYTVRIMKLFYWYNFLQSLILTSLSIVLLVISLIYTKSFCKVIQYIFLFSLLFSSSYFLPPIKGLFRLVRSYRKYKKLKKRNTNSSNRSKNS
ncbi:hypothetical protein FG386_000228 [Cryptosporidium ryanae]|uniref:uncharacterized protein n=1 Tax=Cryptosporidium ryanae TaxID=515981 RepID=UPI00351A4EAF|nr:hypothetical protein FG386_000228 [Cryptosporidium ryanae]